MGKRKKISFETLALVSKKDLSEKNRVLLCSSHIDMIPEAKKSSKLFDRIINFYKEI